jgi:hypothetical protein
VETDVPALQLEMGRCPWCHAPVGIDRLLEQQVCPGCQARFATEAALRPAEEGYLPPAPRLRLRKLTDRTQIAIGAFVIWIPFSFLWLGAARGALLFFLSLYIGLLMLVERR